MKTIDWRSYAAGIGAILVGFSLGGIFLGMLVHESGHAIACLLFGLPIVSWSWSKVVYIRSLNPLVNIFVGLAGGMFQALYSLLFFWCVIILEKKYERRLPRSIFFGFELAFLTYAFHGVINGVWEGLFYQSYEQIHDNDILWGTILLLCLIISSCILHKRQPCITRFSMRALRY